MPEGAMHRVWQVERELLLCGSIFEKDDREKDFKSFAILAHNFIFEENLPPWRHHDGMQVTPSPAALPFFCHHSRGHGKTCMIVKMHSFSLHQSLCVYRARTLRPFCLTFNWYFWTIRGTSCCCPSGNKCVVCGSRWVQE